MYICFVLTHSRKIVKKNPELVINISSIPHAHSSDVLTGVGPWDSFFVAFVKHGYYFQERDKWFRSCFITDIPMCITLLFDHFMVLET